MTSTVSPTGTEPQLTADQIDRAVRYLCETRDALSQAVTQLSDAQWNFKPAADCWSIAEIVEHLALMEPRVHLRISTISDAPPPPVGWEQSKVDEFILVEIPKRVRRVQAPPPVLPTNRWSGVEALQHFLESRAHTIQLLGAPALRGHVVLHPVAGPWDGYQWLLAAGAHCARHLGQIQEVKAGPRFPS